MKIIYSGEPAGMTIQGSFEGANDTDTFFGKMDEFYVQNETLQVGLGKKEEFSDEKARVIAANAAKYLRKHNHTEFSIMPFEDKVGPCTEGVILGLYQFLEFKTEKVNEIRKVNKITVVGDEGNKSDFESAKKVCEIVNKIRTIQNTPSNVANPEFIALRAMELGKEHKMKVTIWDKAEITKRKMGGVLAVGQGSANPPKVIIMEYKPSKPTQHIALVGKGVTFDSGGISLKPGAAMDEMKFDMSGAATVLGSITAAAALKLPVHITAIMPCVENMPDGKSYRPGDIITMMNGTTAEVLNTDAEGRMILADALHYAKTLKPNKIVNFATLTGACVVALGHHHAGLFGTDDDTALQLLAAGKETGEKVWQMPLTDEYSKDLKSEVADIKHLGERAGGAITAAAFLKSFVGETPWSHIDIAGTAWVTKSKSYKPFGGTGFGIRLITKWLETN